jgi:CheY-like chemotaxis protein
LFCQGEFMVPNARSAGHFTSSCRILVVDDYPDTADTTALTLGIHGYDVAVAHDGLEAVDRAVSFQPDVVLLDLAMPRLSGLEALPKIREVVVPNPLIVAVTGYGREEDKRRCAEADFDLHLTKPVDVGVLEQLPLLAERMAGKRARSNELFWHTEVGLRNLVRAQLDMAFAYIELMRTTRIEEFRQRREMKLRRVYQLLTSLPGVDRLGVERQLRQLKEAIDGRHWSDPLPPGGLED